MDKPAMSDAGSAKVFDQLDLPGQPKLHQLKLGLIEINNKDAWGVRGHQTRRQGKLSPERSGFNSASPSAKLTGGVQLSLIKVTVP